MKFFALICLIVVVGYSCNIENTDTMAYHPLDCDSINLNNADTLQENIIPVAIAFTEYFDMDSLTLTVDERIHYRGPLKTDDVLGLARTFKLGSLKNIKTIGIKFNNAKRFDLTVNRCNHIFVVEFIDEELSISSVKKLPHFR